MPPDLLPEPTRHLAWPAQATRTRPAIVVLAFLFSAAVSVAVCIAAIVAPAPAAAAPLVALVCVGGPIFAGWDMPAAIASLRARRAAVRELTALRLSLDELPEAEHPLGL